MDGGWRETRMDRGGLEIRKAFSGVIACERGLLWITWKGSKDLFLGAGQSAALEGARAVAIQALRGPAAFRETAKWDASRAAT